MTNKQDVANQAALDIHEVEESCDKALRATCTMIQNLLNNRIELGVNVAVGHELISELHKTQAALARARKSAVRAHAKAEAIRRLWKVEASTPQPKEVSEVVQLPRAA